jgi:uncharacterized protein (DUF1330 family)
MNLRGKSEVIEELHGALSVMLERYRKTRVFRDIVQHPLIVREGGVVLVKGERVEVEEGDVWRVSLTPNLLGKVFVTNMRLVWGEKGGKRRKGEEGEEEGRMCVSIPYVVMQGVGVRECGEEKEGGEGIVMEVHGARYLVDGERERESKGTNSFDCCS